MYRAPDTSPSPLRPSQISGCVPPRRQGWSEKTQPKKTRPKKPDKTHLKKTTKNGFFSGFIGFFQVLDQNGPR